LFGLCFPALLLLLPHQFTGNAVLYLEMPYISWNSYILIVGSLVEFLRIYFTKVD